jgi:Tfp pilus assembly PilM family ATPase
MSLSLFSTPPPSVAVAVGARSVSAIALGRQGGVPVIAAHAGARLETGVVNPSLTSSNVADPAALADAIAAVLRELGGRHKRVSLLVPDSTARVSLVRLDKVPSRAGDLEQLIRWHVRKAAPFKLEDAQVTWSPGASAPDGGREYVVVLARREVVREYEAACESAGAQAGVVDLASFGLVNAVLASGGSREEDWLLLHVTPDYGTILILRGNDLIFFRNRAEGSEETLADMVHQTAMYFEDRLGGRAGFGRVVLAGTGPDGWSEGAGGSLEAIRRQVESRLGVRTETFDPQGIARFTDRISADAALLHAVTPLVGVLVRQGN